jgi:hypothetical protein
MSDGAAKPKGPVGFIRGGGTSTWAEDQRAAAEHADAERRRDEEVARAKLAQASPEQAMLKSVKLGGRSSHDSIILAVRGPRDTMLLDWQVCELWQTKRSEGASLLTEAIPLDDLELHFAMVCMRCVFTNNVHPEKAQLTVHQAQKKFTFTPRPPKWIGSHIWMNPKDPSEVVTVAGTIDLTEWCSCAKCGWRFQIDDSIIRVG